MQFEQHQVLVVLEDSRRNRLLSVRPSCHPIYIHVWPNYLHTHTARSNSFQSGQGPQKQTTAMMFRPRNQIALMLILNGIIFFLCLSPSLFFDLWAGFRFIGAGEMRYILWLGRVTMLLISAISPILYNVSNERYRKAFAETFGSITKTEVNTYTISSNTNA